MYHITSMYSHDIARRLFFFSLSLKPRTAPSVPLLTCFSGISSWAYITAIENAWTHSVIKQLFRIVSRRYVHAVRSKLYRALSKCREGLTRLVTRSLIVGLPADSEIADKGSNPHIFCCFLPPPSLSGHQHKRTYFLLRRSRWTTREIQQSPFRTFKT
jgi:hypothetical protein